VEAHEFGLPDHAISAGDQEIAARKALAENAVAMSHTHTQLKPFMGALRKRVMLSLQLAQATGIVLHPEGAHDLPELTRLLAAIGAEMPRAHELGSKLNPFMLLASNRENHANPGEVDQVASELAGQMKALVEGIQQRLKDFVYPFPHAHGRLTVADYARTEKTADRELHRVYLDSDAHVDRLFALHYKLIGRLLTYGNEAELALDKL
jgi:hypothetical protein